jgi:beta-N-acetylhexosaminidase
MKTNSKNMSAEAISSAECSRRSFLKGTVMAGVAAAVCPSLLAACGGGRSLSPETDPATVTLEQKIAQMLMVGFRGTTLEEGNYIVRDIRDHRIGGVILFDRDSTLKIYGRNITSPAQLQALTASLRSLSATPLLIAVDQEGGNVCRLKENCGFPPTVTAQYLGTLNNPIITRMCADSIGNVLAENGFNVNFAPVLDLNINPASPAIGYYERSFSADPAIVTAHARLFVEAHDKSRVATCFKHFPGHGSATSDSHLGFVDVTDTWSEVELTPYRTLIAEGNCRMVMTAHVFNRKIDPDLPATLSKPFITGLLREKLAFDGVVVTDDLQMKGLTQFFNYETIVEKSILAGADIILVCNNLSYDPEVVPLTIRLVAGLVRSGKITGERIDKSFRRIMALKQRLTAAG